TPSTNWNSSLAWFQENSGNAKTMRIDDGYANAILEFGARNDADYAAVNNMTRLSGLTYMLNEMRFTGDFSGTSSRTGTISGNALLWVKNLAGAAPRISVDAVASGPAGFTFHLNNELQLLDDLLIGGDGTQTLVINGVLKDYFHPRNVAKSGSSVVALTAHNTFAGNLTVDGGELRVHGTNAAVANAARVDVAGTGRLTVDGGLVRTGALSVTQNGEVNFRSGTVELTGFGSDLGAAPLAIGYSGPATLKLAAGAAAWTPALQIGSTADGHLQAQSGSWLYTSGDAILAGQNSGSPGGSTAAVQGGVWQVEGQLVVGQLGKAALTISQGGAVYVADSVQLAAQAGSTASASIGGAGGSGQLYAAGLDVGGAGANGGVATLAIGNLGHVETLGPLAIRAGGSVTLAGGTLVVAALDNTHGGSFSWQSGTLGFTGPGGLTLAADGVLGANVTLGAGRSLYVASDLHMPTGSSLAISGGSLLAGTVDLDGGLITADNLAGVGGVRFRSGRLLLTGEATGNLLVGMGGVTGATGAATGPGGMPIVEVILAPGDVWETPGTVWLPTGSTLAVAGGQFETGVLHLAGGRYQASSLA
ncbi:MAG TPA: hypothetical protein PKC18_19840, partial [Lacipirellulaceae bacterium]|nr:hypothetical protein [Lacipirellulaceae bacterium]